MTLDKKIVGRWGGSIAVRINAFLSGNTSGISEGDEVVLEYKKDKIIIRKVVK